MTRPDFSDLHYWDARFLKETEPFEWLKQPDEFIPHIRSHLSSTPEEGQNILHIGSGSSTLSLALRNLVSTPQKVHNIDYSPNAVDLGRVLERKAFSTSSESMKWTCGDLLDPECIKGLVNDQLFDPAYTLIVDKSATDAIACGPDVRLNHEQLRRNNGHACNDRCIRDEEHRVHPVAMLALNLAAVTGPSARWLCLSYSDERFPFFLERQGSLGARLFDPAEYWSLESVEPMPLSINGSTHSHDAAPVHRPEITYWLYVLKRTDQTTNIFGG